MFSEIHENATKLQTELLYNRDLGLSAELKGTVN